MSVTMIDPDMSPRDFAAIIADLRAGVIRREEAVTQLQALRQARDTQTILRPPAREAQSPSAIAVIGMAGQFPGARNVDEFWEVLTGARAVPADRRLDERDGFDPLFFRIAPREAEDMSLHQRLVLQESWKALEDAAIRPSQLAGSQTSIFVGAEPTGEAGLSLTGSSDAIIASRLAYCLDLRGASLVVNTGCSSSATALHLACEALRHGSADLAIAGGVFANLAPGIMAELARIGMVSPSGRCLTFDAAADGTVLCEGVGMVVLKRLADAVAAGDPIRGVIHASGANQDGASNGITAPNGLAQAALITHTYQRFGVAADAVSYVEAHGTGTALGDPVEAKALVRAFGDLTSRQTSCRLGSAKAVIGHASAAAGVIGLIKILLCLQHRMLPGMPQFRSLNPLIDFAGSGFAIAVETAPWQPAPGQRLLAGLSAFGHSGTNVHLVIGEGERPIPSRAKPGRDYRAFPLSARTPAQLRDVAGRLRDLLGQGAAFSPGAFADQLRQALAQIMGVVAEAIDLDDPLDDLGVQPAQRLRLREVVETMAAPGLPVLEARSLSEILAAASETAAPAIVLDDLAMTLQQGRDPREMRYVLFARDVSELNRQLDAFRARGAGEIEVPAGLPAALALCADRWQKGEPAMWPPMAGARRINLPLWSYRPAATPVPPARVLPAAPDPDRRTVAPDSGAGAPPATLPYGPILFAPLWDRPPGPLSSPDRATLQRMVLIAPPADPRAAAIHARYPEVLTISADALTLADLAARDHLCWLAPLRQPADPGDDAPVVSLLSLVRGLLAQGAGAHALEWTIVTRQGQATYAEEAVDPHQAAIHGLAGTIAKEVAGWKFRVVDVPAAAALAEVLLPMLGLPADRRGRSWTGRGAEPSSAEMRLQWRRQTLVPVISPQTPRPSYRPGGVYLVIGGAGDIGRVWSAHVLRTAGAQLVWVGRRAEDDAIRAEIHRLSALGPAPLYLSADATDARALTAVRDAIKRRFGRIDGVVHSALTFFEQGVAELDDARFLQGFLAKAAAASHLARIFAGETLDFVLFFSSVVAQIKNPRQSAYAAGCAFNDALAHELNRHWACPVKSINWGYWSSTKQQVADASAHQAFLRLAEIGIGLIEPEEGMRALDALLAGPLPQMGLVKTTRPVEIEGLDGASRLHLPAQVPPPPMPDEVVMTGSDPAALQAQEAMPGLDPLLRSLLAVQLEAAALDSQARRAMAPALAAWTEESRRLLAAHPAASREAAAWQAWRDARRAWDRDPAKRAQAELVETALRALPAILAGETQATDVLFPNGSMRLVENVHRHNAVADHFHQGMAELVATALRRHRDGGLGMARILEIGAGTGGTTAWVLKTLDAEAQRDARAGLGAYVYTDLSKAFLHHGAENFGRDHGFMQFELLNIEQPPQEQGFAPGSFDIVIAGNVLHATRDIRRTLRHAKALLRPGGVLLACEVSQNALFTHLTFGLLEGWWLSEDPELRIPGCPGLTPSGWQLALQQEGFPQVCFPAAAAHGLGQQIIVAISDGVIRLPRQDALAAAPAPVARTMPVPEERAVAGQPRDQVIGYFQGLIARTLKMAPGEVDPRAPLDRYGMDSILAVSFAEALSAHFAGVSSTLVFEHQTVADIADHFLRTQAEVVARLVPQTARQTDLPPPSPPAVTPAPALRAAPATSMRVADDRIAVIGMSGRFPGAATTDDLWSVLCRGEPAFQEMPPERWSQEQRDLFRGDAAGFHTRGGYMAEIDCFDPLFFGISMAEAPWIDPRQRVFLEEAYHAFEDAGLMGEAVRGSQCGVFVGVEEGEYGFLTKGRGQIGSNQIATLAARIAYYLDLQGPNFALSAACSSGLVAIHQACQALRSGECDLALAGGVSLILSPVVHLGLAHGRMLSADGHCRVFDRAASGMVPADAAGAVVLKRLEDALRDGDAIHGCIRASGVNYDGKTMGMGTPNPRSQASLIEAVYRRAGIAPATIQYVLAHSVGSPLTDAVELQALGQAYSQLDGGIADPPGRCLLGSIKPILGHGFAASGVVSLIAMLLAMRHKTMLGTHGFSAAHPRISLQGSPFVVDAAPRPWPRPDGVPRRGAIGTSGLSGTNAHAVIEEFVPDALGMAGPDRPQLFVFSAHTAERLSVVLGRVQDALPGLATARLDAIAHTLQVGRQVLGYRLAFVAADRAQLQHRLGQAQAVLRGETGDDASWLYRGEPGLAPNPLAGLFTGPAATAFVAALIAERALDRLALLWVQGGTIAWRDLHGAVAPVRVRLPGYPFLRERYWIPEMSPAAPVTADAVAGPPAAPLVPREPATDLATLIRDFLAKQLAMRPQMIADHVDWHDYGADSILETRLMLMLEEVRGLTLSGRELAEHPTVHGLAQYLTAQMRTAPGDGSGTAAAGPVTTWPLSEGQQGLWMLEQLDPGSSAYNVPIAFQVCGPWDRARFAEALAEVYRQVPVLRTRLIEAEGAACMAVLPPETLDFAVITAAALTQEAMLAALAEAARQPFDLTRGPLLRVRLWTQPGAPDLVLILFHHLIIDGLSTVVFLQAVWAAYEARLRGQTAALPAISAPYADFVVWEREMLAGAAGAAHRHYWRAQLADAEPAVLVRDHLPDRAATGRSDAVTIPEALSAALRDYARQQDLRPAALFLALYQVVLARLAGTRDPVIGMTTQARPHSRFESAIGYFVNTLPIRCAIDPDRLFADHARALQQCMRDARDHAAYPYPLMVRDYLSGRRQGAAQLLLSTFSFQNFVPRHLRAAAEASSALPMIEALADVTQSGGDELALVVLEETSAFRLQFSYTDDAWTQASIAGLGRSFLEMARALIARPRSRWRDVAPAPALADAEWCSRAIAAPAGDLLTRFDQAVRATPDAVALVLADGPGQSMTYGALQERANQMAHLLLAMGIDGCSPVGVCLRRSLESIVVLLAVLKCGAPYVPVPADDPHRRRAAILADARIKWMIADAATAPDFAPLQESGLHVLTVDEGLSLAAMEQRTDPGRVPDPAEPAYILFTSGSTGAPKGVVVSRGTLAAHIAKMAEFLGCGSGDRVLQFTPLHLDPSLEQVLVTLSAGARLIMRGEALWPATTFWEVARQQGVSIADVTPSYLRELLIGMPAAPPPSLRLMLVGGEAFPVALCDQWRSGATGAITLVNAYGPTETTITSAAFVLAPGDAVPAGTRTVPIGRPLAGEVFAIIDAFGMLAAEGVPGEIHIGGSGLAQGYLARPELTAERFIAPPAALRHLSTVPRWYRTGDLGRYLPGSGGLIECLGRLDRQVKIRGIRIELDDVRAAILDAADVVAARVEVEDDARGERQLTADVTFADGAQVDAALNGLRDFVARRLAPAMRPQRWTVAGRPWAAPSPSAPGLSAAPPDPQLSAMIMVWREVLALPSVAAEANFFELGGHSLLALRLLHQVEERFGMRISLARLLQNPTAAALSALLTAEGTDHPAAVTGAKAPLFFIHPLDGSIASAQELQRAMTGAPLCLLPPSGDHPPADALTVEALAGHYLREMMRVQPAGPYRLAGWSFGGIIAFASAQALRAMGQEIAQLTLIEAYAPDAIASDPESDPTGFGQGLFAAHGLAWPDQCHPASVSDLLDAAEKAGLVRSNAERQHIRDKFTVFVQQSRALRFYRPGPLAGDVTLIRARDEATRRPGSEDDHAGWGRYVTGRLRLVVIDGDHHGILRSPWVDQVARFLASPMPDGGADTLSVTMAPVIS